MRRAPEPKRFPLERLEIEPMAAGHQSLRLTRRVAWEEFPKYARAVVAFLGGAIVQRADSAAERVWTATIGGALFWISLDDFGLGISLDPQDAEASRLIPGIRDALIARRDREALAKPPKRTGRRSSEALVRLPVGGDADIGRSLTAPDHGPGCIDTFLHDQGWIDARVPA